MLVQENKVESTARTLLAVAVGVAVLDLWFIRALIGRVFFDPSNFIADLIYVYIFLTAYAALHLLTGFRFGAWLVEYVTGAAQNVFMLNAGMLVIFYFMGQGADVLGFLLQTLLGFSAPLGFLSWALNNSFNHTAEPKPSVAHADSVQYKYVAVDSQKLQAYAMI